VTVVRIIHTLYEPILQSSLAGGLPRFHLASSDRIRSGQTKRCRQFVEPNWLYDALFSIDGRYGWQGDSGCKVINCRWLTLQQFDRACEEFNLIFCELTSLLLNAPDNSFSKHQKRRSRNPNPSHKHSQRDSVLSSQTCRVSNYVIRRLRGQSDSPSQIGHVLGASAYVSLLPTIWALINKPLPRDTTTNEVLCTVIDHALKLSSKSPCKRLTIEFVARLILVRSFDSSRSSA
jgi:hypothetical protein